MYLSTIVINLRLCSKYENFKCEKYFYWIKSNTYKLAKYMQNHVKKVIIHTLL
jgi:hypothetical protein